jgi:hypothetical protein
LVATLNKWEAACGVKFDNARFTFMLAELDRREYSRAQAKIAEEWILRGGPVRFGTLTLADFFPTSEQLASIGYDATAEHRREYERGFQSGKAAGITEERQAWEANMAYLKLQREASKAVDLDAREKLLAAREEALAERIANVAKREEACRRIERIAGRRQTVLGPEVPGTTRADRSAQ